MRKKKIQCSYSMCQINYNHVFMQVTNNERSVERYGNHRPDIKDMKDDGHPLSLFIRLLSIFGFRLWMCKMNHPTWKCSNM